MIKVNKIKIRHIPDYDADLSYLGEYADEKGKFGIEIEHYTNGQYRYFNAANVENAKQARENYAYRKRIENGHILMIGVKATAEIATSDDGKNWLLNEISSGGLWGIEDDGTPETAALIKEDVEADQMHELRDVLKQLSFLEETINAAPVERADK